jgi:monothiol glutaredoxin
MGEMETTMAAESNVLQHVDTIVKEHPVVLFMKGTRRFPQCGFSARVVGILDEILPKYQTVNVLAEPEVREAVKQYSDWPTIPQLFVAGEFVGGCDIVEGMNASGELRKLLGVEPEVVPPPQITITPAALEVIRGAASEEAQGEALRIQVSPRFEYDMGFGAPKTGDLTVEVGGLKVFFDPSSAKRAHGMQIDYRHDPAGGGFSIQNPNEPASVVQMTPSELKAALDRGESVALFDVRTEDEREIACIDAARHLNEDGRQALEALPKDTLVVFHCHHGGRSQAAAEHYLKMGFTRVHNLAGGIDAWSTEVDGSVPRY